MEGLRTAPEKLGKASEKTVKEPTNYNPIPGMPKASLERLEKEPETPGKTSKTWKTTDELLPKPRNRQGRFVKTQKTGYLKAVWREFLGATKWP